MLTLKDRHTKKIHTPLQGIWKYRSKSNDLLIFSMSRDVWSQPVCLQHRRVSSAAVAV